MSKRDPSKFFVKVVKSCKTLEQLEVARNMIYECPELYYNDSLNEAYTRQASYMDTVNTWREYIKRLNNGQN